MTTRRAGAGRAEPTASIPAPAAPAGSGTAWRRAVEERLSDLERAVFAVSDRIRTRELIVVDDHGRPRIVATTLCDTAELRVQLPEPSDGRGRAEVLLYASPLTFGHDADLEGIGPAVGLQLWAGGDVVGEFDAFCDDDGEWRLGGEGEGEGVR
jgi:hypothetical protein